MRHVLLTRYNVGLYTPPNHYAARLEELGITPADYMARRIPLFAETVASVRLQDSRRFEWIILVDPATPEDELGAIEDVLSGFEFEHGRAFPGDSFQRKSGNESESIDDPEVYLFAETDLFGGDLAVELSRLTLGGGLLSSRLDNDDVIFPSYIRRIREVAENQTDGNTETVIDSRGFVRTSGGTYFEPNFSGKAVSMALSFYEPKPPFSLVIKYPHSSIRERRDSIVAQDFLWEIRLHDSNLRNDADRWR